MFKFEFTNSISESENVSANLVACNDGFLLKTYGVHCDPVYLGDLIYFFNTTGIKPVFTTFDDYNKAVGYKTVTPERTHTPSLRILDGGKIMCFGSEISKKKPKNALEATKDKRRYSANSEDQWSIRRAFEIRDGVPSLMKTKPEGREDTYGNKTVEAPNNKFILSKLNYNPVLQHIFPIENVKGNHVIILPDKLVYEFSEFPVDSFALSNDGMTVAVSYVQGRKIELVIFDL